MPKVTMFTNFLNHHQLMFCLNMQKLTNNNFYFVTQKAIATKRIGTYKIMDSDYPFLVKSYENNQNLKKAYELADSSDFVLIGSSNDDYIANRLKEGKLTFRYSEHLFKEHDNIKEIIRNCGIICLRHGKHVNDNIHMLCSSSYTASDFNRFGVYKNKTYKFGYFPDNMKYNIKDLVSKKDGTILYAGRLLKWKHPEVVVEVARKLKSEGYNCKFKIIGDGEMKDEILSLIDAYNLKDMVFLLGSMSPEEVRKNMEEASIFMFTSDYNEGWGAVLNEAMNSGCACVCSHAAGSSGFLIKHNINGMIYKNGHINDAFKCVKQLIDDKNIREKMSIEAYKTIDNVWNASEVAKRLLILADCIENGKDIPYDDGPCSIAKPVPGYRMYKYLIDGKKL